MLNPQNLLPDEEQDEYFRDNVVKKHCCQYDYRTYDGYFSLALRLLWRNADRQETNGYFPMGEHENLVEVKQNWLWDLFRMEIMMVYTIIFDYFTLGYYYI